MIRTTATLAVAGLVAVLATVGLHAEEPPAPNAIDLETIVGRAGAAGAPGAPGAAPKKFKDFADVTKDAQKIDGLFTLYRKDEHLYAEIKPQQFEQPLLAPITIARGIGQVGQPVNGDDEWVVVFKRVGDRVQLIRRNIHYKSTAGTPIDKAVKQNFTDSILQALPIACLNPSNGSVSVLIDLADIFLTKNFAELPLGQLDPSRSSWSKIKAFPSNLELEVEATFNGGRLGGMFGSMGPDPVVDSRGVTVVIHYSLMKLPDPGYKSRAADDRVGHFLSASQDFNSTNPETLFVRQVQRWRLEKADPKAKVSPPKKQVIWWIEDTVPMEYRPHVEAGILEWNKAFEKVGIRNALAVRWQVDGKDEFDPEDTNYCTFRWIASNSTYAMSALRANPLTGEMIDGDVIFDESWIRAWKRQYALLTSTPVSKGLDGEDAPSTPLALGEIISPILASKQGFGLPGSALLGLQGGEARLDVVPAELSPIQHRMLKFRSRGGLDRCQFHSGMASQMGLAALVMADEGKAEIDQKLPEELIGQGIKDVVMHEVGHSLGLRHNFKASTMLNADQLHDTAITREKGLAGSVMDYVPINLAPKGKKQGDYFSTTIGPYDYWAIEYAYKPIDGDEAAELKKIAARAPEHDLAFGTDGDVGADDPEINRYDLGSDPARFAKDRIDLATALLKDLDSKVVKDGESWTRARQAFSILLQQWGDASTLVASFIGGQSVHRDHKGDKNGRDPIVPIAGDKQRSALAFLSENILSDKSFSFSPALLRRLGTEKWYHWGDMSEMSGPAVGVSVNERILAIQKIALNHCLNAGTLARLQNQELQADPESKPLKMAEVFRSLSDGIWTECAAPAEGASPDVACSTIRRNLQREYLRRLATMVLGTNRGGGSGSSFGFVVFANSGGLPADARSLARLHLKEIGAKIQGVLDRKDSKIDDVTRAHLEECRQRIGKVLDAGLDANES